MHDHLEESYSGDSYILEMMGVGSPWLRIIDILLLGGIVGIEGVALGINQLYVVIKLCDKISMRAGKLVS